MDKDNPLHLKIRAIVNHYDPIKLLQDGCPEAEYDPEVKLIARILSRCDLNPELTTEITYRVFVHMFDERTTGPKENYQDLARDLYSSKERR